jgi:hypothetical protein
MLSAAARESVVGWQRLHQDDRLWVCQGGYKQAYLHLVRHTRLSSTRDHSQQGAVHATMPNMCRQRVRAPTPCLLAAVLLAKYAVFSLIRCLIDQHHQTSSGVSLPNIIKLMHAQQQLKFLIPAHCNERLAASSSCALQADIKHAL